MSNVDRIIQDSFCNGYADKEYDMEGAEIIAEGDGWIECRKANGKNIFIDFQIFDWNRNPDGSLKSGILNLRIDSNMQELIDNWCR